MEIRSILLTALIIHATLFSYGQSMCKRDKIYGAWKSVGSIAGWKNIIDNVDSLKKIIHIESSPHIYEFKMDGTYTYNNPTIDLKKNYFKNDIYSFDEKVCEIVKGNRKKSYKQANLKILYVDDQYMIITNDNNPHGDYTTLYSKQ